MVANTGERRRRLARPASFLVVGTLFALSPLANYLTFAWVHHVPLLQPTLVFRSIGLLPSVLLLFPLIISAGFLTVHKWAWWAFLAFWMVLIAHNVWLFFGNPRLYNAFALVPTLARMAAIFYVTQRDVSAPFFRMYPRGWRLQKRTPVQIPIVVGAVEFLTTDMSPTGFYIEYSGCPWSPNEELPVLFQIGSKSVSATVGVVRVDDAGVGLAFRDLDRATRRSLGRFIRQAA